MAYALDQAQSSGGGEIANASISLTIRDTTKSLSLSSHNHDSIYVPKNESYLPYVDKRSVNYTPYSTEFKWKGFSAPQLKQNGVDSLTDGGTYHSSIFIYPWGDSSGGAAHNIAFTDNGNLWMRYGTTSWSGWSKVWHSTNSNSTSVAWSAQQLILPTSGRLHANGQSFYIGNSNNGGWVGMQDICSASALGDTKWSIRISGAAIFQTVQANTYNGLGIHSGRNNESNKIVRTDGSGYIQAGWINTTSGSTGASGINKIYASNDDYIRWVSPADFRATIVGTGQWNFMTKSPGCYQDITVTGDSNTYYPVVISLSNNENSIYNIITISKWLGTTTPSWSGNHSNGTSSGVYRYSHRIQIWDGNGGDTITLKAWYGYAPFVAHTEVAGSSVGELIIWLRGGGAWYRVSCNNPLSTNIYYSRTNLYNDTYPAWVEPRTTIGNAGIYNTRRIPCNVSDASTAANASSADTAVKLTNTRTLWGQNFNGTANVSGQLYNAGSFHIGEGGNEINMVSDQAMYLGYRRTSEINLHTGTTGGTTNSVTAKFNNSGLYLYKGWFRSTGSVGWYNETYGGGIYMSDSTYVRTYASKKFLVNQTIVAYRYNTSTSLPAITFDKPGSYAVGIGSDGTTNRVRLGPANLDGDSWVDWTGLTWYFQGTVQATSFSGSLSGNASTATRATNATYSDILLASDVRNVTPSSAGIHDSIKAVRSYFYQVSNVISGYGSYADLLYLDTYSDSSGGNPNGLAFCKNANRIIHLYGAYKGGWNTAKPLAYKEEVDSVSSSIGDIGTLLDKINGTVV